MDDNNHTMDVLQWDEIDESQCTESTYSQSDHRTIPFTCTLLIHHTLVLFDRTHIHRHRPGYCDTTCR